MGRRGPQAEPARLRLLKGRGNGKDSAGRPVPVEPNFNRGVPDAPEWLSAVAREQWDLCAPGLDALDLLKPEDQAVFVAFCESWATYVKAIRLVRAGDLVSTTESGYGYKNPALGVAESAGRDLLRFAREFGLTPAAAQLVGKPRVSDGDGDADPFAGGGETSASS